MSFWWLRTNLSFHSVTKELTSATAISSLSAVAALHASSLLFIELNKKLLFFSAAATLTFKSVISFVNSGFFGFVRVYDENHGFVKGSVASMKAFLQCPDKRDNCAS